MIYELVLKNSSYRRFYQDIPVDRDVLRNLIDLARITASAENKQPLKYVLCNTPEKNEPVFSCLGWAGYLKDWHGPAEGERPAAYIVILGDREISESFGCDHGIAAQTILLGATENGYGGCMLGNINRSLLRNILDLPEKYEILLVIALGRPKETIVLEQVEAGGDIRYRRDSSQVHYVPKRMLDDIIVG
jgi:nitroreductase